MQYLEATIKLFSTPKWAVLKQQRLLYLKRKYPDGKISPHFGYREFFCRDGMPFPIRACKHLEWYLEKLAEPMCEEFGTCFISGPYRHYWYNKDVVKGAIWSYHVWDRYCDDTIENSALACDLTFADGTPNDWALEASRLLGKLARGGGIGIYRNRNFTHVDTRRQTARWGS